jgi:phospholipase A1
MRMTTVFPSLTRAAAAALLATLSGAGFAQAMPALLAECAAIATDSERLACYDRAAGRAAATRPTPAATQAASPQTAPAASAAAAPPAAQPAPPAEVSLIDKAWDFNPDSTPFRIDLYRPNYFLVGRYSNNVNTAPYDPLIGNLLPEGADLNHTEAAFQLSFKARLWTTDDRRWGAWLAYTQQSQWQIYNGDTSRPFRETNYMPEAILSYRPDVDLGGGFQWHLFNLALNHQSNGRSDAISRSWNRVIGEFGVERENLVLLGRLWWRIPESSQDDDNPDISRYMGYGDLTGVYKWRGNSFLLGVRGNVSTGKGAVQFTWTTPPLLGPLRGYVKAFSGYGESMIDYNWNQTTIGAGVTLNDLF